MSVLEARDLVAGYRHARRAPIAIVTVDTLAAPAGHLIAVLGPNGTGKSTLLRTLVGAQAPLAGTVILDGAPLHQLDRVERARRIAVVLTDRIDPGWLTVGDVVSLGRHPHTDWRGLLRDTDIAVARAAADRLGIAALWSRPFAELSDGQRQRALVARALAQEPAVLVLDEPTAFLDVAGRIELTIALADLADDGLAVIVATHDLDLALSHADRVWLVNDGTVADRSPEHLLSTGELTRAFSDGTVEVDTRTGVVRARLRAGQPVVVDGHDLDSLLVRRMVTRLGATVVEPDEADNDPWTISRHDGTWTVATPAGTHECTGFDELSSCLRTQLAAAAR
jgi:iron complex transport system ATP-binding protein